MRISLGYSQSQLARLVHINQSTISRIERDCLNTSFRLVFKILLFLQAKKFGGERVTRSLLNDNVLEFVLQIISHRQLRMKINDNFWEVLAQLTTWAKID